MHWQALLPAFFRWRRGLGCLGHLLAAVGGDGILEIDSNPNPLREDIYSPAIVAGCINLGSEAGMGIDYWADLLAAIIYQAPGL